MSGCGSSGEPKPGGSATVDAAPPKTAADCGYLPLKDGDPGVLAGFDWTTQEHPFGDPVRLFVCVDGIDGGAVSIGDVPDGVAVDPRDAPTTAGGSGVVPFMVTVAKGASGGALTMSQTAGADPKPVVRMGGPEIVVDDDSWHFASPGD